MNGQDRAPLLPPPFADGARPGQLDVYRDRLAAPGRQLLILVDGLGAQLLAAHRALTPTLRRLEDHVEVIRTVAPSTTATAMTSLHTGVPPIEHGVLGYRTFDAEGRAVHQLTGDPSVDPAQWMTLPGLAESTERPCVQVSKERHQDSFLTRHLYRGWEFRGHGKDDRVEQTVRALRRVGDDGIVHLHLDDVDHSGHTDGVDSQAWREALETVDATIGALLRRSPAGTTVTITADHGMVETRPDLLVELSGDPVVDELVVSTAGEPRALMLRAREGDEEELAARVAEIVEDRATVLTASQALQAGVWGPEGTVPDPRVAARLPQVLVLARGAWTVEATALRPKGDRPLRGVHGSLTEAETLVPLLQVEI